MLDPGDVIGERYEILQLLGEGGMGAVYKARDRELDRLVTLKVVRPELARNPEIVRRFKQELILARQVTHKNVIRIHDLGQAEGLQFITMDFVEGQDLRGLLRERVGESGYVVEHVSNKNVHLVMDALAHAVVGPTASRCEDDSAIPSTLLRAMSNPPQQHSNSNARFVLR
jgi:serine/threonine protein kinase